MPLGFKISAVMPKLFQVIFSNKVELLYSKLKEALFSPPSLPFTRRLIIVPSPAMKSWLMLQMANDPDLGIAAGLEISYLDQTLAQLSKELIPQESTKEIKQLSPPLELPLAIEGEIQQIVGMLKEMSPNELSTWQPLLGYLKISSLDHPHSLKTQRRLTGLCEQLATLFCQYGIYGGPMVQNWETAYKAGRPLEWQQQLWCRLFCKVSPAWTYPYREASRLLLTPLMPSPPGDIQVHVFAMSHLSRLQHTLLMHFANEIPVGYYMLSPCQAFWIDVASDRERRRLQDYWSKRGISSAQQDALEEYLRDRNPLLANFGKLGREMVKQIDDSAPQSTEDYVLTSAVENHLQYEELLSPDRVSLNHTENPLSLLEAIQADMLLMRTPENSEKIFLNANDHSIQVHVATTRMREVQILYDTLLSIMANHTQEGAPIGPGDIIVMAPNIAEYAPFIRAVFGASDSVLSAQIMDIAMTAQSSLTQGFLHLLSLSFGRWDAANLLQLFDFPAFQKRHQLSGEDVQSIRSWVKAADVRWGDDSSHRNELLSRHYCHRGMVEETPVGTWEHAIERLLTGLVMSYSECNSSSTWPLLPLENVTATQSPLLGKWIVLMRSLRDDLKCLSDGTCYSLSDWTTYLRCLVESYFVADTDREEIEYEALLEQIDTFRQAGYKLGTALYPFNTIKHHLSSLLYRQRESYRDSDLHAVRFCSMLPMRAIPGQVIAMLGMDEGAFPRETPKQSLNLLQAAPNIDYSPSNTDYDRFLFLEILLSARCYVIITYQGYSSSDGKEQSPALLVTELLTYLDHSYLVGNSLPSKHCIRHHPVHSFDKVYFESTTDKSQFQSYSQHSYRAAKAYYHTEKTPIPCFVPEFVSFQNEQPVTFPSHPLCINLKELSSFARNPIRTYFNKTLGIYLDNPEDRIIKSEEDFYPTALQSYILKKTALKQPLSVILQQAEKEGLLPIGAFKTVAVDRISHDITLLQHNLASLGIFPHDIFEVTFSEHCLHPIQLNEQHWRLPSLKINGIQLVGTLPEVSSKGLVAALKDDKTDILKVWPQFLVLACAAKQHTLPIESQLLLTKGTKGKAKQSFFSDPFLLLESYLDYYLKALIEVSPLIPEWIPPILSQDESTFSATLRKTLTDPFNPLYNDYLLWTMRGNALPSSQVLMAQWQPTARHLFGDLFAHW